VSSKAEQRAAREAVDAYHEAELTKLVERVGEAIDGLRSGQMDAFEVDQVLFQYSRAAKQLWKYCNLGPVDLTASLITRDESPVDWWGRGEPRR
jgi:hypothetical protein